LDFYMANATNITAPIALILFLGSVVYLSIVAAQKSKLEESLHYERLYSETLLSEKLLLEKDIQKNKIELKALSEEKHELERQLENALSRLLNLEKESGNSKRAGKGVK
jgi:hypothetical protein